MRSVRLLLVFLLTLHGSLCNRRCSQYARFLKEGFQYTRLGNGKGFLGMVGDVNDVLQGIITPQVSSTIWTRASIGPFGFGAAAVGPLQGLGEAIFVNGIAFVRQTDNGTRNYFQTITGREFRTPFSLFVSKGSSPDGNVVFFTKSHSRNISMANFYDRVYAAVGRQPFCFYGLTEFAQLDAIAVSKAPIYREPLFGDLAAGYYTQSNFQLRNEYGLTFGCAANFSDITDPALNARLLKLLYLNPMDTASRGELQVHSHVLNLRRCLKSPEEINVRVARDVFHMLSNATISYINAKVFVINNIQKLIELPTKNRAQNSVKENLFYSFSSLRGGHQSGKYFSDKFYSGK